MLDTAISLLMLIAALPGGGARQLIKLKAKRISAWAKQSRKQRSGKGQECWLWGSAGWGRTYVGLGEIQGEA